MVGRLKNNETIIKNRKYNIPQHGFAKDMKFEKINNNLYMLKSNLETLKMFPFEFELFVEYEIINNRLNVKYKVINNSKENMLFGIGGHPGIKIDSENKEYYLELEKEEENIEFMEVQGDLISNKPSINLLEDKKIIRIRKDSFINDAIMIKKYKSTKINLFENNKKVLTFGLGEFPIVGIWSIPKAPFICIEPWFNTADKAIETGFFKDKEGIIKLESNKEFNCNYYMEFFD